MHKIAEETNHQHTYLLQHTENQNFHPHSRIKKWHNTNLRELYVFLTLVILMPHSKKQILSDYWKRDKLLGATSLSKFMSRNRFQALLRNLHFASNTMPRQRDRLWKVRDIMKTMTDRYSRFFVPTRKWHLTSLSPCSREGLYLNSI